MPNWNISMIKRYGNITLEDIVAKCPADGDFEGASHVRVQPPSVMAHVTAMQSAAFHWTDRTLKTKIVLSC